MDALQKPAAPHSGVEAQTEARNAALSRVREANLKLKIAADPLGLLDGDGNCADDLETNAPTPERAVRNSWSIPAKSRDRNAEAWRSIPIVERMIERGQIANADAQATMDAAQRFYRDFVLGHRQSGLVAKWGDSTGAAGTPISQQAPKYYTDRNGVEREQMSPEERRAHHHSCWINACKAIGIFRCPVSGAGRPGIVLQWMMRLVCEDYEVAREKTPTLEDAGRAYLGCKSPPQAMAAGAAMIKGGLERLVAHYEVHGICASGLSLNAHPDHGRR